MKTFISLFFILLSGIVFADTITKDFIDINNTSLPETDPLYNSYEFNNYPDNYGEMFVDVNSNGIYDKNAVISIYSKEKDLSDGKLDGMEDNLLANIFVEIDEFCPRKSLQSFIDSGNSFGIVYGNSLVMSSNLNNHFLDSQIMTWDPNKNGSYNGDFSLKHCISVNGIVSNGLAYSDNILTYNPTSVTYTVAGECSYVTVDINASGRVYLKNNTVKVFMASEPCTTTIIKEIHPSTTIEGNPPEKSSGGGCFLKK